MLDRISLMIATGFGLGYSPLASGTVGSVLGVVLVYLVHPHLGIPGQIVAALALAIFSIPVCDKAEKQLGLKDDGRIVADEYLTFPICMIGLPVTLPVLVMAFLTNRVLDIIKPPPARQMQNLKGGMGIVLDDVASSFYSLLLNHLLYRYVLTSYLGT